MKDVYIVMNTDDEPVLVFDSKEQAEYVANTVEGLSSVIFRCVMMEGAEIGDQDMPDKR